VPDCVTLRLDRRIVSEESRAAVEAELRAVSAGAATAFPRAGMDVRRILLATPLTPTPFAARLTILLRQHASTEFEEPITAGGVPLYTDARHFAAAHYAAARVPIVLYGAGPRSIENADATAPTSASAPPTCTLPPASPPWRWPICRKHTGAGELTSSARLAKPCRNENEGSP